MNTKNPNISILMPVKDAGKYLHKCIDSIINQTYTDWEVIAVNDHSNDNSLKILREYENNYPRIKVVNNKGMGIVDALNTAYDHATGLFITRMDADDIMDHNKLKLLLNILEKQGTGFVATGFVKYFSTDKKLNEGYKKYAAWLNNLTKNNNNFNEIYKECVIPSPCWMMHKKDLDSIGAFHSETYPEDYDLAFRMYTSKIKITGVNKIIHLWRDYPERASRNDENYADNTFSAIKIKYFLAHDHDPTKKLILWGAGKKGKTIAKSLIKNKISFEWITNNPKKIGKKIYDIEIIKYESFSTETNFQIIIAISAKGFYPNVNPKENTSVFYFC